MILNRTINRRTYLLVVILLAGFLSILKKGSHDLQEWDESRNGVNAYEMLHNGDFINLYYNNKLDTWNAKPPLMIWLITASYKVFGYNEFALRFPSTISTILFFILCFYTIILLETELTAFFTCLILLAGKSILGNHIGLTGDFDALLVVFLTASVYTFIVYSERQKTYAIYLTALFTGLAFYTKGPASLVLIPGFILYAIFRENRLKFIKDKHVWFSAGTLLIIISSWFFLAYAYGKTSAQSVYGSKTSIETMLIHDTFRRLTAPNFDNFGTGSRSFFFFFAVLDSRLNLWNYMFYLVLLSGIFFSFKHNVLDSLPRSSQRLVLLSFCLILPLSLVLTFSQNQHNWYLAPTFMFIAFLTAKGILMLSEKWKPLYWIAGCLLVFTLARQFHYISSQPTAIHDALTENKFLKEKRLVAASPLKQDVLLYLKWLHVTVTRAETPSESLSHKGGLILFDKKQMHGVFLGRVVLLQEIGSYYLGVVK